MSFKISPSVGVSRLGNSENNIFHLSPSTTGGLPYQVDADNLASSEVVNFKDDAGMIIRQGQLFKIYDDAGVELKLGEGNVTQMEWTVHLANKKAAWYQYSELQGNLLYGEDNSYAKQGVALRNPTVTLEEERRALIIDPGPRTISGSNATPVPCNSDASYAPEGYPVSFPTDETKYGEEITTLGELRTDVHGRLIVLGGLGRAGGSEPLVSYGGSDTWHDDISDGAVYCTVTRDGVTETIKAWIIVGSPDFVPEIVNISTLSDTMFDVAVRKFDLIPDLCEGGNFKTSYKPYYHRDILPIIERLGRYQWVANVQSMMAFPLNFTNLADPEANQVEREQFFSYFRDLNAKTLENTPGQPQEQLFQEDGTGDIFPMMPLNSGSNSVSNQTIEKFLALDATQYFFLSQWAAGDFLNDGGTVMTFDEVDVKDQQNIGNCVGLPMCPGIEVTWSVQNQNIYESAYIIAHAQGKGGYNATGLTPSRDECADETPGCEPGDLTKRMACPWQADFFQCTIQLINFNNDAINKADKEEKSVTTTEDIWVDESGNTLASNHEVDTRETTTHQPLPPSYYSYWWPPQSPWDVLTGGDHTVAEQQSAYAPFGQQLNYARGINSFTQMVEHWSALAFIRDRNSGHQGYPYFTETERIHELFTVTEVAVGQISGNSVDNDTVIPVYFIDEDTKRVAGKSKLGAERVAVLEKKAFKKIQVHKSGLGFPRSGTRSRR